jgi:hypothetical protein
MSESPAGPAKISRQQTSVQALIALVAVCGVVLWAARLVWETQHPAVAAARAIAVSANSGKAGAKG